MENAVENNLDAPKKAKWYMTVAGGLVGLIIGLIPPALSILLLNELYFVCLMVTPILACLFIRLLGGHRNIYALIYAFVLSLIVTFISGFMLDAGVYIRTYSLPDYEIVRLTALMIADFPVYFISAWNNLTADIFNIIILIAYLLIGILASWEFILNPNVKKTKKKDAAMDTDDSKDDYEYVYEDETDTVESIETDNRLDEETEPKDE